MLVVSQKLFKRCLMGIDFNSRCMYINTLFEIVKIEPKDPRILCFSISLDPNIRYTLWSILIGYTLFETAMYACTQTQAQRYMCVKDTRAAQR